MWRTLAVTAITLGATLSALNWCSIYQSYKTKRFVSSVPFFGALLLGIGLVYFPTTRPFAWLGIILDYGTLAFVLALPKITRELWSTSDINLVHRFSSVSHGRNIDLKLFKRGVFTVRVVFDPPVVCNEYGALINSYGLQGSWKSGERGFNLNGYSDERKLEISSIGSDYILEEDNYPSDKKYKYDSLESLKLIKVR